MNDPACEYGDCTKEADWLSKVWTADEKTYTRPFCDEHKQAGADQLTNFVASHEKKRPVRWDAVMTGKRQREKAAQEKERQERWDRERVEQDKQSFYKDGWLAYLYSGDGVLDLSEVRLSKWDKIDLATAQERYQEGWNAARQAEQEQGKAVLLLNELLAMIDDANEWYGSDFEKPRALVERAIAEIKKGGA